VTPRSTGFTLLEVLVAMFIMALVLTFAFQAYQGISEAYTRVSSTTSRNRAAEILLDRLERELVGAVLVQREEGADPLLHPYFFFGQVRAYADAEGDELRFVTQTPLRSQGSAPGALALVTYGSTPSKLGPGLALLRQEESLPPQLAKEIVWTEPQIVADNVAQFLVRFRGEVAETAEEWDSTAPAQLDQLPVSIALTVSLWETGPDGESVPGEERSRLIQLPVRPFRLSPEEADGAAAGECGGGLTVGECLESFSDAIGGASSALSASITSTRAEVPDTCWNAPEPSPALQRLKVLMGGVPGFDAAACE
jgi:prepilin-type N-terminal cleavage/methylation domain-containing protein